MIWHRPYPGPEYWSWRCLKCDQAVDDHATWWMRILHKWGWV